MNYKLLAQKCIKDGIEWLTNLYDTYKGLVAIIEIKEDLKKEQLKTLCKEIKKDIRVKTAIDDYDQTITIIFNK